MKRVFVVHGFRGEPNNGWKPWLKGELEKEDVEVNLLSMPNPKNPKNDEWVKTIAEAVGQADEEVLLVGHSLGVPAIFGYLENLKEREKIGGAVLVGGPCKLNTASLILKKIFIGSFFEKDFNFEKIKKTCNKFYVIHGDNDESVPLEHALFISKNLDSKIAIIKDGGHLSDDCKILPEALEALEEMIK